MNNYVFTASAAQDLIDIWEFIAKDDIDAADRVRDSLYAAVDNLVTLPGMGYRRADLNNEALRVWPVFSYLIIYRFQAEPLEIVRVLSGYRDIATLSLQ